MADCSRATTVAPGNSLRLIDMCSVSAARRLLPPGPKNDDVHRTLRARVPARFSARWSVSKRIQVSGARSVPLFLLALLGLGAFVSPAAAQWNGLPFNAPIFAQSGITIGNGITDSYNSDLGQIGRAHV